VHDLSKLVDHSIAIKKKRDFAQRPQRPRREKAKEALEGDYMD
jgi:hypothetical protein